MELSDIQRDTLAALRERPGEALNAYQLAQATGHNVESIPGALNGLVRRRLPVVRYSARRGGYELISAQRPAIPFNPLQMAVSDLVDAVQEYRDLLMHISRNIDSVEAGELLEVVLANAEARGAQSW